jgi:hypothetical protein
LIIITAQYPRQTTAVDDPTILEKPIDRKLAFSRI